MNPTVQTEHCDLYLCDCREVLPHVRADAIVTDPPFGARRPSARRTVADRFDEIQGNDSVDAEWAESAFAATSDGGCLYSFCTWDTLEEWRQGLTSAGWRVRSCIVWDKLIHGLADLKTCWGPRHEFILFGAKGRHELVGKRPVDIIANQRVNSDDLEHPYQKPVGLLMKILSANSGIVLDPFMGSGTTLVAAVRLGRKAIGIESDQHHFETAVRRVREAEGVGSLFDPSARKPVDMFAEVE